MTAIQKQRPSLKLITAPRIALKEIAPFYHSEIKSHAEEFSEKFKYYSQYYLASSFLRPLTNSLCINHFYSGAIITIITHPFLENQKKPLFNKIIDGIKIATLGPLLAYALIGTLPSNCTMLTSFIIINMIRNLLTHILFFPKNKSILILVMLFPAILLTGVIRGIILYNFCFSLKKDGFNGDDIFFFTMIIKHILEPQVRKLETIDTSLLICKVFNQH